MLLAVAPRGRRGAGPAGSQARRPRGRGADRAWVKIVREKADNGGWLVVRGTGAGDQLVAAAARATLSHAVVLDKQKEEVIEAVASGVRATPLRALLAQAQRLQIIRPPGWTPAAGQAAVARARSHIGQKYDWLGPVAAQDDKRFYCTELAVDSYRGREAGWKMGALIFPADMATIGTVIFDSGAARSGERAGTAFRAPADGRARRRLRRRGRARAVPGRPAQRRGRRLAEVEGLQDRAEPAPLPRRQREAARRVGRDALRAHRADVVGRAFARADRPLPADRARSDDAAALRPLPARRRPHGRDDGGLPDGGGGLVEPARRSPRWSTSTRTGSGGTCASSCASTAPAAAGAAGNAALTA